MRSLPAFYFQNKMIISKTKISKRMKKKTNSSLVETINFAKKHNLEIAKVLSSPTRKRISSNLEDIDEQTKQGETIIVPGKVLGQGEITKKIKIIALSFSSSAFEKLKKAKCETSTIEEEFERNKGEKLEGKIIK